MRCTRRKRGLSFFQSDDQSGIYRHRRYSERLSAMGFSHFKIEGRSLGSALILEFLLYYMTKPEYQLRVREEIYLDNSAGSVLMILTRLRRRCFPFFPGFPKLSPA